MIKSAITVLVLGAAGLGAYLAWGERGTHGPAAPRPDLPAQVHYEWVLAEGELLQGTADMQLPQGINVALDIDNDLADTLVVRGYDLEVELPPDTVVPVTFYTYKPGRYAISLASGGPDLGQLVVKAAQ